MKHSIANRIERLSPKARQLLLEKAKIALKTKPSLKLNERTQIIAYVEGYNSINTSTFKENLRKKLPDYMVPNTIIAVETMPLLPNGKIDRKTLLNKRKEKSHSVSNNLRTDRYRTPNTTEKILITIWEEVLGFSPIKNSDNFFEIGGDSILSIQINTKARKKGIPLPPNAVFEYQTITELASLVKSEQDIVSNSKTNNNPTQKKLIAIWEKVLGFSPIHIDDNFFEIGGDSILSIQINTEARKQGLELVPNAIFEHQTIEKLSLAIESATPKNWKYIVPIKKTGSKSPIFCIHAGGGHAFTYQNLAKKIDADIPVFALQSSVIFNKEKMPKSIEQMSQDYANEIIKAQPYGNINIVVYCFSTCIGLEIASYLKAKNRTVNIIVADTIAEHRLLFDRSRFSLRVSSFLKRFFHNPIGAIKVMIGTRVFYYFKPLITKVYGSKEEKNAVDIMFYLEKLLKQYHWGTKVDLISLIVTKKNDKKYNESISSSWEKMIVNNAKIPSIEIEANHITMFDLPDVLQTAKAIEKCII